MWDLLKRGKAHGAGVHRPERTRHSRGWVEVLAYLKSQDSLRVLDFGATSPSNINYLTTLGHSVYMADVVGDAQRKEWLVPGADGTALQFDTEAFAAANLDFSGRDFDVILLWDTANYLPAASVPVLFDRLRTVLRPGGKLLAFFHGRTEGPDTAFSRYQLVDGEHLQVLFGGDFAVQQVYQTRQIEGFLSGYSSMRFFLGKDNVREVAAVR